MSFREGYPVAPVVQGHPVCPHCERRLVVMPNGFIWLCMACQRMFRIEKQV